MPGKPMPDLPQPDPKADHHGRPRPAPEPEPEPRAEAKSGPESGSRPEPESKPEPRPEAESEAGPVEIGHVDGPFELGADPVTVTIPLDRPVSERPIGRVAVPRAFDPMVDQPARMHGSTHRNRQDVGLSPGDVVEQVILPGNPPGGWTDFDGGSGFVEEFRGAKEALGREGKGINLIVDGPTGRLAPDALDEVRAGSLPARVVRRAATGA